MFAQNLVVGVAAAVRTGASARLTDCSVQVHVGRGGALVGDNAQISRCVFRDVSIGISTGAGSIVEDCEVRGYAQTGIVVGDRSTVRGCALATALGGTAGISVTNQAVVADNFVNHTGVGSAIRLAGLNSDVHG